MKIRTKTFLICSVVIVVCLTAFTGGASSESVKDIPIPGNARTKKDIIGMYQEIVKLRQRVLEGAKMGLTIGRANLADLIEPTVKLSEARIQLAQFQGNRDAVLEELRSIIKRYTDLKESLQRQVDVGLRRRDDIVELEIALLQTRIRLAKTTQETIHAKRNRQ